MSTFLRLIGSLLALGVCLWPTWFVLLVRHATSPQGFWENIALLGGAIWLLGGAQVIFLIAAIVIIVFIWAVGR